MTTATNTIDLTKFCGKASSAYPFAEPFVAGGWRYATDGRICVRVPAAGEPDSDKVVKHVEQSFAHPRDNAIPWPTNGAVYGDGECWSCDGTGYTERTNCKKCDGRGETFCDHCGRDGDCEECGGKGYSVMDKACRTCKGKGFCEQIKYRMVGEFAVRGDFDALIRSLPDVRWAGNRTEANSVHFVFAGGEGVVMRLLV